MRVTIAMCLLASALGASADVDKRQIDGTTRTDSNGNTIVNSGIPGDSSMTMTETASTSLASQPPGAESSLAIIIDGSTMYESGQVTAGPGETTGRTGHGSSSAAAETTGTGSSSAWGSKVTQAPMLAGGVAAFAYLAM